MSSVNPYTTRLPTTDDCLFHGREQQVREVVEGITSSTPIHYAVVGGPRMGKTSFLRCSLQQMSASPSDQTILLLQLDTNETLPASVDEALQLIERRLVAEGRKHLRAGALSEEAIVRSAGDGPVSPLERIVGIVKLVQEELPRARVVLAINHMDRIKPYFDLFGRQLAYLVSTSEVAGQVALLLFGTANAFRHVDLEISFLATLLKFVRLQSLTEEETMALIQEPVHNKVPAVVAQKVYSETGGHPYLTQYILEELFKKTGGQVESATVEQVDAIINDFSTRGHMKRWFDRLEMLERNIYEHYLSKKRLNERELFAMGLMVEEENVRQLAEPSHIRDALDALLTGGFIRLVSQDIDAGREFELSGQMCARFYSDNYLVIRKNPFDQLDIFKS